MNLSLVERVAEKTVPEDEASFVRRLAAHDGEAWRQLFHAYYTSIYRLAYVRTFQAPIAEDIASETLAEAARGIGRYKYRGVPFRAWLFRIANNLIVDYIKAQVRRPQVYLATAETTEDSGASALDKVEADADFFRAIRDLPADQRTVLILRFANELSLAETAEAMGKSSGAIKQLQHRAIAAARERLAGKMRAVR
jgi:RNA polymerase sigma-70 factor (ECF subfamily)